MTRIRNLLFITIIVVLCDCTISKLQFRSKRSGRDYILHSCTATAQLMRKHRNHAISDLSKTSATTEFTFSLPKRDSKYHHPIKSEAMSLTRENKTKMKLPNKRLYHGRRIENRLNRINFPDIHLKDTPLRTVRIESIHKNRPPTFMKKDPLPELESNANIPAEKKNTDSKVVIVKPLH